MAGKRRGLVSGINALTVDELVNEMFNDSATENKVKLYCKNENMNKDTRAHANLAYTRFMKLKKERRQAASEVRKQEREAAKPTQEQRIAKWNEENPKSFRYRTVPEILELIINDSYCRTNAMVYMSSTGSRVRNNPELINRVRKALVAYYILHEPNNPRLEQQMKLIVKD